MSETNRTAGIFTGTTNTNSVNLGITTLCSMKCPKCSIGMPALMKSKRAYHEPMDNIFDDLLTMTNSNKDKLKRIHITGGEPTLHPQFEDIADRLTGEDSRLGNEFLTIESNGWGYEKYRSVFRWFDKVFITHYLQDAMYPGSPDNTAIVEMAQKDLGDKLIREPPVKHETQHLLPIVDSSPCSKWFSPGLPCGYYHRKLYPCCVSFGIDENLGIPITADWREQIRGKNKGCHQCCYRGT